MAVEIEPTEVNNARIFAWSLSLILEVNRWYVWTDKMLLFISNHVGFLREMCFSVVS